MREKIDVPWSKQTLVAIVLVLALVSGAVVGASYLFTAGSGTAYETGSGLVVNTNTDHGVESGNPFNGTDSLTVNNVTFTASGNANVTVDRFEGTWTNVSSVDASSNDITIDPADKPQATVGGSVTALSFRDSMSLDDDNIAFEYSSGGSGTVTVNGLAASTDYVAVTPSGTQIDSGTTDSSGAATISVSSATDESVILFTNTKPAINNSTAAPTENIDKRDVTLEINVSDQEFTTTQGDEVTAEFLVKAPGESSFTSVGNDTLTSNGTASVSYSADEGGTYDVKVEATDSYGAKTTSAQYNFTSPSTLEIREETSPHSKITSATATVKIFEDRSDDPTIVERTTNNGAINLTNLPVGSKFIVTVQAQGYHNRSIVVDSIYSQQTVFLLNKSRDSIETRFVVSDRTGKFAPENTQLIVQKAINRSKYDSNADGYSWTNMAGDELGADEAYVVGLESGDRYRVVAKNDAGDARVLGAYTPETNGTINLNIGSIVVDPEAPDTVGHEATRTNETSEPVKVTFEYNDSTTNTTELYLHIYEYNNESNELLANTTFNGPFGTFSTVENVPAAENDTTWVVEFTGVRSGEDNVSGQIIVGPQRSVLESLSPWVVSLFFVGMIWTTAGLFSQINGDVGGLVVAAEGAMMWYVGLVPTGLGSGVVALALITAAILFIRERRAGGL